MLHVGAPSAASRTHRLRRSSPSLGWRLCARIALLMAEVRTSRAPMPWRSPRNYGLVEQTTGCAESADEQGAKSTCKCPGFFRLLLDAALGCGRDASPPSALAAAHLLGSSGRALSTRCTGSRRLLYAARRRWWPTKEEGIPNFLAAAGSYRPSAALIRPPVRQPWCSVRQSAVSCRTSLEANTLLESLPIIAYKTPKQASLVGGRLCDVWAER